LSTKHTKDTKGKMASRKGAKTQRIQTASVRILCVFAPLRETSSWRSLWLRLTAAPRSLRFNFLAARFTPERACIKLFLIQVERKKGIHARKREWVVRFSAAGVHVGRRDGGRRPCHGREGPAAPRGRRQALRAR